MIGTPLYMAPEIGRVKAIDGRVDLYSLGVILYELLTGVQPLRKFTAIEILSAKAHDKLPAPQDVVLPAAVESLLGKLLEKDRDRRYRSAGELLADIAAIHEGQPISAGPPTLWRDAAATPPARVRPALPRPALPKVRLAVRKRFIVAGLLLATAIGAVGISLWEPIFIWIAAALSGALITVVLLEQYRISKINAKVDLVQEMLGLQKPSRYNPKYMPAKATWAGISAELAFFAGLAGVCTEKYFALGVVALLYAVAAVLAAIKWSLK
jgi:hypothetical protein